MSLWKFLLGEEVKPEEPKPVGCIASTIIRDLGYYGSWEFSEHTNTIGSTFHSFSHSTKNYTLLTQLSDFDERWVKIVEVDNNPLTKHEQSLIFYQLLNLKEKMDEKKNNELKNSDELFLQKTFPNCYLKKNFHVSYEIHTPFKHKF